MKKSIRYSLFSLLFIVVIIIAANLYLTYYINTTLKNELQSEVIKQSGGTYSLSINEVHVNLIQKSLTATAIKLTPSIGHEELIKPLYSVSASRLTFEGFELLPFVRHRHLIIDKIKIESPAVVIYRAEKKDTSTIKREENFTLFKLIQKKIQLLLIRTIAIKNADISVFDHVRESKPSLSSKDNSISILDFKIDKTVDEQSRFFIARKVEMVINNFSYITSDSLYVMKTRKVTASYTDSLLCLEELKILPNYSKKEFGDVVGRQATRMKVSALKTCFNKMDVKQFFEHGWMIAKELKLDSFNLEAYRDKNDEFKNPRAKSLQQIIRAIPFFVAIDTVKVNDGSITYEELAEDAAKRGKIFFTHVNATINGLSNDTLLFRDENNLVMNATASFMNKGKLQVQYIFPLNTDKTVFDCSGKVYHLPLSVLNIILEPASNITVKEGLIDSMLFSFHANDVESKGKMILAYKGLKIQFLNKDRAKTGLMEKVKAVLAHELVIKENNPAEKEPLREEEIKFARDPDRFIFYYTWKTLLSGIKKTMGVK